MMVWARKLSRYSPMVTGSGGGVEGAVLLLHLAPGGLDLGGADEGELLVDVVVGVVDPEVVPAVAVEVGGGAVEVDVGGGGVGEDGGAGGTCFLTRFMRG